MKGTLYIAGQEKPVADLNCEIYEFTANHAPDDRYRINYEYDKRYQKIRIELHRELPMILKLEDGRQARVSLQAESSTPGGVALGVLRVRGDFSRQN